MSIIDLFPLLKENSVVITGNTKTRFKLANAGFPYPPFGYYEITSNVGKKRVYKSHSDGEEGSGCRFDDCLEFDSAGQYKVIIKRLEDGQIFSLTFDIVK